MGLFDTEAFDETPNRAPTQYIEPGDHLLAVERHKYLEDNDAFVAELKVLKSDVHPVGSIVSYFVGNGGTKFAESNRREIKHYVSAVLGVDDVTSMQVTGTCTDEGLYLIVGKKVFCKATMNASGKYTKKLFTTAPK